MNKKRTKKFIIIISILLIVIIVNILVRNFIIKKDIKAAQNNKNLTGTIVGGAGIGIGVLENGKIVAKRVYVNKDYDTLAEALFQFNLNSYSIGKKYPYNLQVENLGSMDEYVRILLHKSYLNQEGNKVQGWPSDFELNVLIENGWICDEAASTSEREVWYYENILPSGEKIDFSDYFRMSGNIYEGYKLKKDEYGNIMFECDSDLNNFCLEIEVDAVQTLNAKEAIKGTWGVDVNIDANGKLSLM